MTENLGKKIEDELNSTLSSSETKKLSFGLESSKESNINPIVPFSNNIPSTWSPRYFIQFVHVLFFDLFFDLKLAYSFFRLGGYQTRKHQHAKCVANLFMYSSEDITVCI